MSLLDSTAYPFLLPKGENTLYGVSSTQNLVFRLRNSNNWATGVAAGTFATPAEYPTAMSRLNSTETYVLHARLPDLQAATPPPNFGFSLTKLRF